MVYELNLQILWIIFYFDLKSYDTSDPKFCTYNDNKAAVACKNLD